MRYANRSCGIRAAGLSLVVLAVAGCGDMGYVREMAGNRGQADGGRFTYMKEIAHPVARSTDFESCTLRDLRLEPKRWADRYVEIRAVFHLVHNASLRYYTRYTAGTHEGFSVWDSGTRLWEAAGWDEEYPYFFARKMLPVCTAVGRLEKYQNVIVRGRCTDLFGESICIEVMEIEPVNEMRYTDEILSALRRGNEALRAKQWPAAREAFKRASAVAMPAPGAANAWAGLAASAEQMGEWPDAALAYDKSLSFDPENSISVWGAGRAYMMMQSWAPAADRFKRCERLLSAAAERGETPSWMASACHDTKLCLATSRAQLGSFSDAAKGFEELIASDPADAMALNNFADALLREGKDAKRALDLAEKAARLRADSAQVQHTLGWARLANGNAPQAASTLEKAWRAAPSDAQISFHYAQALAAAGKPVLARAIGVKVAESKSSYAERAKDLVSRIDADEKKLLEKKK